MSRIEFHQTNYIGKEDKKEFKICPFCNTVFNTEIDECPSCKVFLPSFPTSWARSATNIFLLRKVLEHIYIDLNTKCTVLELTELLTKNYIISYNHTRGRNDLIYWRGGPMRRASEYLSNLQYLGFIKKWLEKEFYLTENGINLANAENYSDYIKLFADAFMKLKITNEFDVRRTYSNYDNHILFQSIRIINDLNELKIQPTLEHIALAIMSKNEDLEYKKALETCIKYSSKEIKEKWFGRWQEFNRVIKWVFVRWLNQTKIIDIELKNGTIFISLTKFWKDIYNKYKNIYLLKYSEETTKSLNEIIDESIDKKYLRLSISSEINNRAWALWENIVKENFNKIDIELDWYKKSLDFVNITLPTEVLISLTWWTRHNPDLILKKPLWLVDPKKDVNIEMHKVFAYDKYWEIVNWFSIIVTQKIMRDEKIDMMRKAWLRNTLILDWYALQVLSDNKEYFDKEKVIKIFADCKWIVHYLNEEKLFDDYIK